MQGISLRVFLYTYIYPVYMNRFNTPWSYQYIECANSQIAYSEIKYKKEKVWFSITKSKMKNGTNSAKD